MFDGAQVCMLPDGKRLHLCEGPIDIILEAFGPPSEITAAYKRAEVCFLDILSTLVGELSDLRKQIGDPECYPVGPVARRMFNACWPHRKCFVTPMAAVAGSVADEVLTSLSASKCLSKAYINNGGDIAFYLAKGESLTAGIVGDYHLPQINATCAFTSDSPVRGIATSGWKGRSFSLGIADTVSVLAENAAKADVAATLIANAVDVDHPSVSRVCARELDPDSDLENRAVTTGVGKLEPEVVEEALNQGVKTAKIMLASGLIHAAVLILNNKYKMVGDMPAGLLAGEKQ